jgi:carboxylate-amine ligase
MDCCTTLEDAIRLAALNQSLVRALYRLRRRNQRWRNYPLLLVGENRWRAMRYSFDSGLLDLGRQQIRPYGELLEELIEFVREDAEALGCVEEVEGLRRIPTRGTSAHRQLAIYEQARREGATEAAALRAVVEWLVTETARC